MNDKAIMPAEIVNAKNIGVHKSLAVTLHIPEELAMRFFELFGWPTMSNPVPVALARLATAADKPVDSLVPQRRGRPPNKRPAELTKIA